MQRFRPGGEIRGHPCNGMVNTMRSLESRGQEEERTKKSLETFKYRVQKSSGNEEQRVTNQDGDLIPEVEKVESFSQ